MRGRQLGNEDHGQNQIKEEKDIARDGDIKRGNMDKNLGQQPGQNPEEPGDIEARMVTQMAKDFFHRGTLFPVHRCFSEFAATAMVHQLQELDMDKDRVKGSAKQAKGAVKDAVGKMTGDAKLRASGKADKMAGKIQNAVGGARDAARGR